MIRLFVIDEQFKLTFDMSYDHEYIIKVHPFAFGSTNAYKQQSKSKFLNYNIHSRSNEVEYILEIKGKLKNLLPCYISILKLV